LPDRNAIFRSACGGGHPSAAGNEWARWSHWLLEQASWKKLIESWSEIATAAWLESTRHSHPPTQSIAATSQIVSDKLRQHTPSREPTATRQRMKTNQCAERWVYLAIGLAGSKRRSALDVSMAQTHFVGPYNIQRSFPSTPIQTVKYQSESFWYSCFKPFKKTRILDRERVHSPAELQNRSDCLFPTRPDLPRDA
jgi:hypothetical protein